jgi:16S rRNA (guanine527-N7)-methyltransferase
MTALHDLAEAKAMLLEDALRAVELVRETDGPIVDVGSGGGSPGIPLAVSLPRREIALLEAERRKCDFLERWAPPNARVVWGRAEEQETDGYGVALAKALAAPPVAVELCLPLIRPGGVAILWVGPSADLAAVARVAALVGGGEPRVRDGLVIVPKVARTPAGFPRRPGMAKKRPLA